MMEVIGMEVHGIPEIVLCTTACAVSLALFLYPLPTFYRIYVRYEPTERIQLYPLIFRLLACLMWIGYGPILLYPTVNKFQTFCLNLVSLAGFFTEILYILLFAERATVTERERALNILCVSLLFLVVPYYIFREAYAFATTVTGILMYASTIPSIVDAYTKQDTSYLPWVSCTMHFLNAVAWFAYAVYTPAFDIYLAIANGSGIILGIVQLLISYILVEKFQTEGAMEKDLVVDSKTPLLVVIA